jgi:hypothetical protein
VEPPPRDPSGRVRLQRAIREHRGSRGDHHSRRRTVLARVHERPIDAERAHELHRRRIRHVDFGERRRSAVEVGGRHDPARDRDHGGAAARRDARPARRRGDRRPRHGERGRYRERRRDHQQPLAVEQQLRAVRGGSERERADEAWRTRYVDRAQRPLLDGEDRAAVGLDHIGLIDAGLLSVRRRVRAAGAGGGRGRGLRCGRGADAHDADAGGFREGAHGHLGEPVGGREVGARVADERGA